MTRLSDFLSQHATKNTASITNTRIPDKMGSNQGGKYYIPEGERDTFFDIYHAHVFDRKNLEYMTETQPEIGALAIDIDFRYNTPERKYDHNNIVAFIEMVADLLNTVVSPITAIPVYVFEKQDVNVTPTVIKDGIHFIFGIRVDRTVRKLLYDKVLRKLGNIWNDLEQHLANTWEGVLDRGVFIGTCPWQLYGSRKPGHAAYGLTGTYEYKDVGNGMEIFESKLSKFDVSTRLSELSVQHPYPVGEIAERYAEEYRRLLNPLPIVAVATSTLSALDKSLEDLFESSETSRLRETHEYVMCLPPLYFDEFDKWIRVGWALKNTSVKLFPSWLKFSSQSSKFDSSSVNDMQEKWDSWGKKENKLTDKSIAYWARNENPTAYNAIRANTLDFLVMEVISQKCATEFDYATIMHFMYKELFACISIRNKTWFEYNGNRWIETDSGTKLRNKISAKDGVYDLFQRKMQESTIEMGKYDPVTQPEKQDAARKKCAHISVIMTDLKRTDKKENIMREACHLFFIPKFYELLDSKNHLLCFTNGVIDFSLPENQFRQGVPEDFTSKCTNIPYIPITQEHASIVEELKTFMRQLFPVKELRAYMWAHAASALLGKNTNQTFNIYTGAGRNGKSIFVELMGRALGEYKATVPVTLITQKRTSIGGTSSEIVQLMGVRYAVMQEPSMGDTINEGIMKELTGGDKLQGRALFKDSVTFTPQFKLVVCTNTPFEIKSTDDGTWRRIRMCEFMSLFTEDPVDDDEVKPYQFKVDKNIDDKFEVWKTVFMAMLVERAITSQGDVADCSIVMAKSQEYRQDQDNLAEYVKTSLRKEVGGRLKWSDVNKHLNSWWQSHKGGSEKVPNPKIVQAYISKIYGSKIDFGATKNAWAGIALVHAEVEGDPES